MYIKVDTLAGIESYCRPLDIKEELRLERTQILRSTKPNQVGSKPKSVTLTF